MVLQHEYQHNETILQTLQLKQGTPYTPRPVFARRRPRPSRPGEMVRFPGGEWRSGPTIGRRPTTTSDPVIAWTAPFFIDV